jgi:hypothetical protein
MLKLCFQPSATRVVASTTLTKRPAPRTIASATQKKRNGRNAIVSGYHETFSFDVSLEGN